MANIGVIGAGAWGTAFSKVLCESGHQVSLWCRDSDSVTQITKERENKKYLPDIRLPDKLFVNSNLQNVVSKAEFIIVAVPSHSLRETIRLSVKKNNSAGYVILTKGFELGSTLLSNQVFEQEDPALRFRLAVISGPGFASEIANGLPAALTIASRNRDFGHKVVETMHSHRLRLYYTDDVPGVLVGGAMKNIVAIASGICDALDLGESARAALITRGLSEMTRVGQVFGGLPRTFQGLSGIGDLCLTCTSELSRNRQLGTLIGKGVKLGEAVKKLGHVAEGVNSAREVGKMAEKKGLELPITSAVLSIMSGSIQPGQAVAELLDRAPREEN